MQVLRTLCTSSFAVAILAACAGTDPVSSLVSDNISLATAPSTQAGVIRVRCELRAGRRSKISVDGNNLSPLNARWSARVSSGANNAAAPVKTAIGDQVEFDFDSNPNDIAAGATPIARTFITLNPSGPDVSAQILDVAGNVAASGSAECRSR